MSGVKPVVSYDLIFSNVERHVKLTQEEKEFFISLLKYRKLRRKQYLLQEGEVSRFENFVLKGCLRVYHVDENGFEHIVQFAIEDWWVGDLYSFLTESPSNLNIDVLEECELLQLEKKDLELLYKTVPKFERLFRILLQNAFVSQQQRILQNLSKNAEQRYLAFIKKYPKLEQRLPQHQIASYLGITPEFLSKIRKKLSERKSKKS